MDNRVKKNRFGFYEIIDKPTQEELKNYYAEKYYQETHGSYETSYSEDEILYFKNKLSQKHIIINELLRSNLPKTFLDIGAGEGWALDFFKKQGWHCVGLDYSDFACKKHHADCLADMIIGDIYENVNKLIAKKKRYSVILLDNVLEHVINPLSLLNSARELIESDGGVLIIEVPNDFSAIQNYAIERKYISHHFWVVYPDHLSYFNREGLINLSREAGFECERVIGDYPVDFNIINKNTNYIEDKTVGKSCHQSRVEIENLMHRLSPEKTIKFYQALGELGMGRQLIGFFKPI